MALLRGQQREYDFTQSLQEIHVMPVDAPPLRGTGAEQTAPQGSTGRRRPPSWDGDPGRRTCELGCERTRLPPARGSVTARGLLHAVLAPSSWLLHPDGCLPARPHLRSRGGQRPLWPIAALGELTPN